MNYLRLKLLRLID